ncbi:MAG: hypothetical protein D6769_03480 [Methanobacteriota archaeon]|nr:MAG: hypothetical protein D6769_03480 [Euryarchaeota archaeon]
MKRYIIALVLIGLFFAGLFSDVSSSSIGQRGGAGSFSQSFGVFAGIGIAINFMVNILRYMLAYISGDDQLRARTFASVMNSIGTAVLIGALFIMISATEGILTNAFGLSSYDDFLSNINDELTTVQQKLDILITNKLQDYGAESAKLAGSYSVFGLALKSGSVWYSNPEEIGKIQQRQAELTAIINTAYDTELAIIVGQAAFNFFVGNDYNAAGFLLLAGLAYYALDISRPAGAALIALGIGAFYVYPIAYQAFLSLPQFPDVGGASGKLLDIGSLQWCAISTVPSTYLTKSDASVSFLTENSGGGATSFYLTSGNIRSFLNSLYLNFLIKHGVALSVTLLFIYHAYLVLTGGMLGRMLTSRLGRFL